MMLSVIYNRMMFDILCYMLYLDIGYQVSGFGL